LDFFGRYSTDLLFKYGISFGKFLIFTFYLTLSVLFYMEHTAHKGLILLIICSKYASNVPSDTFLFYFEPFELVVGNHVLSRRL
jgi:hypothetical protein